MPRVGANGQELYYETHGEGEPLLCVMGLGADCAAWVRQLPDWSAHLRTIVFDNRDVGRSSRADAPYEIADMAADTLALADALELDGFHLVGVSLGGAVAQEVALAAPERVRTLTLAVTFAGGGRWARERARLWAAEAPTRSRADLVDELLLLTLSERTYEDADLVGFLRHVLLSGPHPPSPQLVARQLQAAARHEARDRLGSLAMPVHVIGAEHDLLIPVWKSRELAGLIPGARLTVLAGAAHGVYVERAQEFNRAVLEFVRTAQPV